METTTLFHSDQNSHLLAEYLLDTVSGENEVKAEQMAEEKRSSSSPTLQGYLGRTYGFFLGFCTQQGGQMNRTSKMNCNCLTAPWSTGKTGELQGVSQTSLKVNSEISWKVNKKHISLNDIYHYKYNILMYL